MGRGYDNEIKIIIKNGVPNHCPRILDWISEIVPKNEGHFPERIKV